MPFLIQNTIITLPIGGGASVVWELKSVMTLCLPVVLDSWAKLPQLGSSHMEFTCTADRLYFIDVDKQEIYKPAGMLQIFLLCIVLFF